MARATGFSVLLLGLAGLAAGAQAPQADGRESREQGVRRAFVAAWKARFAPAAERAGMVTELYRHAWLGTSLYLSSFTHPVLASPRPVPREAKAEDILAGKYGRVEPPELWAWTNRICLDIFAEQHARIIPLLAADLRGTEVKAFKAARLIGELVRHVHWRHRAVLADGTFSPNEKGKQILNALRSALFPVLSEEFLSVPDSDRELAGVLERALRDLDDPRAIPLLLGERPSRGLLRHFEALRTLQRRRQAHARVIELLSHPDKEVRWRAIYALAESGDPRLAPHALKALRDPAPEVREQALNLAYFLPGKSEGAIHEARKARLHDEHRPVRLACAVLFAQEKGRACAGTLLELLRDGALDERDHSNVVQAVQNLTGSYFGYHRGSDGWQPTTANNQAAIARFEQWTTDGPALVMRLAGAKAHYQVGEKATIEVFIRNRRKTPIRFLLKRPFLAIHLVVTSPRRTTFGYDPFPTRRIAGPRAEDYGEIPANTEIKFLSFSFVAGQHSPRGGAWRRQTGDPETPLPFQEKGTYRLTFRCRHFAVPRDRYPAPQASCGFTIGDARGGERAPRPRGGRE